MDIFRPIYIFICLVSVHLFCNRWFLLHHWADLYCYYYGSSCSVNLTDKYLYFLYVKCPSWRCFFPFWTLKCLIAIVGIFEFSRYNFKIRTTKILRRSLHIYMLMDVFQTFSFLRKTRWLTFQCQNIFIEKFEWNWCF